MSKSLGEKHYIGLFEDEASIRRKVKTAVTDTGEQQGDDMSPGVKNLFNLINACGREEAYNALMQDYKKGILKYKDLKEVTADALVELNTPFRKKKQDIMKDHTYIEKLSVQLSEKAREIACKTLHEN